MNEVYRIRLDDLEGFPEPDLYFATKEAAEAIIEEFKKIRSGFTINYEVSCHKIFSTEETLQVLREELSID